MRWRRFFFNVTGGISWAMIFGVAFYYFGSALTSIQSSVDIAVGAVALIVVIAAFVFLRRKEKQLGEAAATLEPSPDEIASCTDDSSVHLQGKRAVFAVNGARF